MKLSLRIVCDVNYERKSGEHKVYPRNILTSTILRVRSEIVRREVHSNSVVTLNQRTEGVKMSIS